MAIRTVDVMSRLDAVKEFFDSILDAENISSRGKAVADYKEVYYGKGKGILESIKGEDGKADKDKILVKIPKIVVITESLAPEIAAMEEDYLKEQLDENKCSYGVYNAKDPEAEKNGENKVIRLLFLDSESIEKSNEIIKGEIQGIKGEIQGIKGEIQGNRSYMEPEEFAKYIENAGGAITAVRDAGQPVIFDIYHNQPDFPYTVVGDDIMVQADKESEMCRMVIAASVVRSGDVGDRLASKEEHDKTESNNIMADLKDNRKGMTVIDTQNPGHELVTDSVGAKYMVNGNVIDSITREKDDDFEQFCHNYMDRFVHPISIINDKNLDKAKQKAYESDKGIQIDKTHFIKKNMSHLLTDAIEDGLWLGGEDKGLYNTRILEERSRLENAREHAQKDMDTAKVQEGADGPAYQKAAEKVSDISSMISIVDSAITMEGVKRGDYNRAPDVANEKSQGILSSTECFIDVCCGMYLSDNDRQDLINKYKDDPGIEACAYLLMGEPKLMPSLMEELQYTGEDIANTEIATDELTIDGFEKEIETEREEKETALEEER